jgi:hypothetical protein
MAADHSAYDAGSSVESVGTAESLGGGSFRPAKPPKLAEIWSVRPIGERRLRFVPPARENTVIRMAASSAMRMIPVPLIASVARQDGVEPGYRINRYAADVDFPSESAAASSRANMPERLSTPDLLIELNGDRIESGIDSHEPASVDDSDRSPP